MSSAPRPDNTTAARPFLVQKASGKARYSPLVLWHLLSLDAPTVAATWVLFAAWGAGVAISWLDPVAMFVAVWILYAADRLLDARVLDVNLATSGVASGVTNTPELEARHLFHHQHRSAFLAAMLAATAPLAYLLHRTDNAVLHLYVLLACFLSGWLLLVHARPGASAAAHRLPKELAVGVFFPAAVFIPTVARAPALRLQILPLALAFAALCTLNCLFLFVWEHPRKRNHAHVTTQWSTQHLVPVTVLVAVLMFCGASLAALHTRSSLIQERVVPHRSAVLLACAVSTLALLGLHAARRRLPATTLRALADLVLLTPLPLYLLALVRR